MIGDEVHAKLTTASSVFFSTNDQNLNVKNDGNNFTLVFTVTTYSIVTYALPIKLEPAFII